MPYARADTISWYPGGHYHIYNRGAGGNPIFLHPDNYQFVLQRLGQYSRLLHVPILAYCLMPNHFHLLVRQEGEQPAGMLPQMIFNSYTKAFNKRYGRSGTLFEHRYQAKSVLEESYLIHLSCYIHANPVKHGLVREPGEWPYSSYLEWIGQRNSGLADEECIHAWVKDPAQYQHMVMDCLEEARLPAGVIAHLQQIGE
jgi:putative transposase